MASTNPIERPSLTTSLEQRYEQAAVLSGASGNAKDVGKVGTNFVDTANKFSNQFQPKNPEGLTDHAKNYSTDVLKVPTKKYAPSGRL